MSLDFVLKFTLFGKSDMYARKISDKGKNGRIIELVPSAGRRRCAGYYVVTVRLEKKITCLKYQQKNS